MALGYGLLAGPNMSTAMAMKAASLPDNSQSLKVTKIAFEDRPSLVISDETLPDVIYNEGSRDLMPMPTTVTTQTSSAPAPMMAPVPVTTAVQMPQSITRPLGQPRQYRESNVALGKPFNLIQSHKPTPVTARVDELADEVVDVQNQLENRTARLDGLNNTAETIARDYYALIAGMNAKLQSGTTPGNPDLVESWDAAQVALNALGETSSEFAALGNDLSDTAARAAVIQDNIRSAYLLSGARDEDHENLDTLEDRMNDVISRMDRVLTQVNDEMNRRTSYLRSERLNMQTLQLAIANGDLYGGNIKNRMFQNAQAANATMAAMPAGAVSQMPLGAPTAIGRNAVAMPSAAINPYAGKKPLVIIRFDKPNLQYENALYGAINEALSRRPDLQLDLMALSPVSPNAAENALNVNETRKNGESVLRALTQMGMPAERLNLNTTSADNVDYSEVRLYVR